MKNNLSIYDIKRIYEIKTGGHYFSRQTTKFFHQTLRSFHVSKLNAETCFITAPIKDEQGKVFSESTRVFDVPSGRLFSSLESLEAYRGKKNIAGQED